jgi:hypothetical protein
LVAWCVGLVGFLEEFWQPRLDDQLTLRELQNTADSFVGWFGLVALLIDWSVRFG